MASYAYSAVNRSGKRIHGDSDATTPVALRRTLEQRGLMVLEVSDSDRGSSSLRSSHREVLELTRALAALLTTGMPLARALRAASLSVARPTAQILASVRTAVERGASLADALARHSAFSPLYVGVVRAGERSGDLGGAFGRLATQLDRDEELRARLVSAAVYPLLLGALGTAAVGILLLFVLPRFADLLSGAGATLPRSTVVLLAVSSLARRGWLTFVVAPALASAAALWARGTHRGQRASARLLLRIPLVRGLRADVLGARFARLLSVLLRGGAPLLTALQTASESIADPLASEEIVRVRARVRVGIPLHRAIAEGTLFPRLLPQLAAAGEESGRLQEFLAEASVICEHRADHSARRLVALVEPATIIVFGAVIGLVALSLFQAVYSLNPGAFR